MNRCAEEDRDAHAAGRLHVAWAENRNVCTGHAHVRSPRESVVAVLLEEAFDDCR